MPLYVYDILDSKGKPTGETLEVHQSMKDAPLTKDPQSGRSVRRAIVAPAVAGSASPLKAKSALSNKNLERLGFTKYQRSGKGTMERVAGKEGPRVISDE